MATLIVWTALAVVLFLLLFVLKRILGFVFGRSRPSRPFHDELADVAEDVAAASRIGAALASAAAFFAAPAGLMAIAAGLGLIPTPLISRVVPVLVVVAVGAAALSAAAKLYAKARRKSK